MIKAKELKENALVQIQVSKGYYLMVKMGIFYLINNMMKNNPSQEYFNNIGSKNYDELDDDQKLVKTMTLLIAEIELQAKNQNLYVETDVLEPGDEGYVAPTED
jgi:hypothetical protein